MFFFLLNREILNVWENEIIVQYKGIVVIQVVEVIENDIFNIRFNMINYWGF